MPKTIVAGQGVRILLQYPLVATFLYGVLNVVMSVVTDVAVLVTGSLVVRLGVKIIFLAVEVAVFVALALRPSTRWILGSIATYFEEKESYSSIVTISFVSLFLLLLAPLLYVGRLFRHAVVVRDLQLPPEIVWNWSSVFHAVLFLFVITFVLALPFAAISDPPLPTVEITPQSNDSYDDTVTGHLVAHADGVWHFFDKDNTLISLPDEKVAVARVGNMTNPPG